MIEAIAVFAHVVFGALWTGAVVFVALVASDVNRGTSIDLSSAVVDRLRDVSRASAVVTFLSGGYLASGYGGSYFLQSTRGLLLSAMVLLWLVLMVTVEIGAARTQSADADGETPLKLAGVAALLLLVDVGLLLSGLGV
ncbi:MAG: hypothetical protein ABEJ55_01205 [Halanaeroarchaeum sp.]